MKSKLNKIIFLAGIVLITKNIIGVDFGIIEKEKKMQNKEIKIDDKVFLNSVTPSQYPYPIPKYTIFNVDFLEGDKARISNDVTSIVVPLIALEKISFEEPQKEDVRVISCLKDLDGLENGKGLKLSWCDKDKNIAIMLNGKCRDVVTNLEDWQIEYLKSMYFKFEYKPLRTKQEVLADVTRLACERSQDCRGMILKDVNTNKYFYTDDYIVLGNVKCYFQEDTACDLVKELNDILEREKNK